MNQDYWLTHPRPNNPNNLLIAKRDNIKSVSNDRSPSYLIWKHIFGRTIQNSNDTVLGHLSND